MTEEEIKLREKYSRIPTRITFKRLQRINLIYKYLKEKTLGNDSWLKITEISTGLGMKKSFVYGDLKEHLVEYSYVKANKKKSRPFLSIERNDGTFDKGIFVFGVQEQITKEKFREVIEIFTGQPNLLNDKRRRNLECIENTLNSVKPDYVAYCNLVEFLWNTGILHVVKLSIASTANRYSV